MAYNIRSWEKAIKSRDDIVFEEIYLNNGLVARVIGRVAMPYKQVVKGKCYSRPRKVRWDEYGNCYTQQGKESDELQNYNLNLS